jgi:hypothetical protein
MQTQQPCRDQSKSKVLQVLQVLQVGGARRRTEGQAEEEEEVVVVEEEEGCHKRTVRLGKRRCLRVRAGVVAVRGVTRAAAMRRP